MGKVDGLLIVLAGLQFAVICWLLFDKRRSTRASRVRRKAERQFRGMVDGIPVLLWAARPDTTLFYLNRYSEHFSGIPLQDLQDTGWFVVVHPDDLQGCIDIYTPAVEAQQPFVMEYRLRRADGQYRWVLGMGVPNYQDDGTYIGYVGCSVDITDRKNGEVLITESRAALAGRHREIQQLAGRLITAHEDERRRLARELHDDLTQRLARMAIDVGQMEQASEQPKDLRALREELVRLSEDVHALSYRLHPSVLDDLGLTDALRTECDRVSRRGCLRVEVTAPQTNVELPQDVALCLFRIAQEALSNIARHAQASMVSVLLAQHADGMQLVVSDNGQGFDTGGPRLHPSLGLASMRERVRVLQGDLEITSVVGQGTTIVARVPTSIIGATA